MELLLPEFIDDRALVRLDGPEGELRALIPLTQMITDNEETPVGIGIDSVFLLDADTGELITTSGDAP